MIKRIGFCCKYKHHNQTLKSKMLREIESPLTDTTTTVAWCNRQSKAVAEKKLLEIVYHNMQAALNLVRLVGTYEPSLRMVRLSSGLIPLATHHEWKYLWQDQQNRDMLERGFKKIGDAARNLDVRLSFHPGQFCCIVSDDEHIVNNSITELEYHATMAKWMGYSKKFQDFKINVHLSGKGGPSKFNQMFNRLSSELRNCLTLENDEFQAGLDEILVLCDDVAVVLDIHHHWVRTGEYIQATDDRCKRVIDSWRGVRPVIHYSLSREDQLVNHDIHTLPDLNLLLSSGHKKQKLRAHSNMMWNRAANQWAKTHWEWADIMVEAKNKNLASFSLYEELTESTYT